MFEVCDADNRDVISIMVLLYLIEHISVQVSLELGHHRA